MNPEKRDPKSLNQFDMILMHLEKAEREEKAGPHQMGGDAISATARGTSRGIAHRKLGQMAKHRERWTATGAMAKGT